MSKYWRQGATIARATYGWSPRAQFGCVGRIHHAEDPVECARREQAVRDAVGIAAELRPVAVLGIGYAAAPPKEKEMYPLARVVHLHSWGRQVGNLTEV